MKGKLLRFMSAFVAVPILVSSVFFARDVEAASKTYADDSVKHYEITDVKNEGYYFEPSADGKYQAMIYFHGASDKVKVSDIGNLPDRLKNDMNKWIDMGYCDKMVVVTPAIYQEEPWGITEFREFVDNGYLDKLVQELKSGSGIGAKVDTSKPILVAGYSQGGAEALYVGAKRPDTFYNVGAFSPSWCCYNGTSEAWLKKASDFKFSSRTDGHFYISCGAGEDAQFPTNYDRYLSTASSNGQNIPNRFKSHKFSSEFGAHGWKVFEPGTFEFLYYVKNGSVPSEEITVNAVMGKVTISGTASVGNTLTASCVSYYYSSLKYQWYRIDPSTGEASAISGATSNTYTITSADVGYKLRCKVKDKNGGAGYTYKTTDVISSAQPQPTALTGSVTVSGSEIRYGYKVTASVSGSNASNFKYQWMRGDSAISGATSNAYTFTESDIGKQISCVVTDKDEKYTGSISSSKTAAVKKAYGPAVPNVTGVDCSAQGAKDGKIQNVTTNMEYAYGNQSGPYTACTGTTITGLAKGDYYVRYKETSTTAAGAIAIVTIREKTPSTKSISDTTVSAIANEPYTGSAVTPGVTVKYGSTTLVYKTDYTLSYSNNVNAGTATVIITGKGNYTGTKTVTFTITAKSLSGATVSSVADQTYIGSAITPAVTVKDGSKTLVNGTHYSVSYSNNVNAGTATVTITGKGNYSGTKTANFKIAAKSISGMTVSAIANEPYTGSAVTPGVTVKDGSTTLVYKTDYTLSYSNNVNVGTATVTITGKGNYSGTKTVNFTITSKSLSGATVSSVADQTYTGSAITPAVTVKDGSKTLVNGTDYSVSYSNNVNAGTATITITGKGNYSGTKTASFKIVKSAEPVKKGWQNENGKWYLYDNDGKKVTGFAEVGGKTYYMDETGVMKTGWVEVDNNWYYFNNSGVLQTGWQQISKKWYYLDPDTGAMKTGWFQDGEWYYLNTSGEMLTGWREIGGEWYYLASSGAMQTGWINSSGTWYYLKSSGAMATKWQLIDGEWYWLGTSGAMATRWQNIDGNWYWFGTNGAMVYSTSIVDGGKTYYFNDKGVCTNP